MKVFSNILRALFILAVCAYASAAHAITINLQYQSGPLFASTYDATAKAAISAAAADLSAVVTSSLGAINTDVYVGTNGSTTATMNWYYPYTDPTTGASAEISNATIAANTVTIHVGTRSFLGSTLGVGGPAGIGFSLGGSGFGTQWVGAMAIAEAASEAAYRRGGGPRIGTLSGTTEPLQGVTASYSIDYGLAYGSVAFDNDTNNNGQPNSAADLNNYWHWNHTTPVAAGKRDLYSVALHEMIHVLGIGASAAWNSRITGGTNWTGPEVLAITGSGTNLVSGGHIANGTMSYRISDGMPQGVVMDHLLPLGQRKSLTVLDLAFMRDIGWETITPSLPSSPADFNNDGLVNGTDLGIWQSAFASSAAGDADGDGITDGRDFLIWQRDYTGSSPLTASVAVPEPSSIALVVMALMHCCLTRRAQGASQTQ